ncbi:MAG: DUF3341 domain-containing protein [Phycisphaeraceae bacterium]
MNQTHADNAHAGGDQAVTLYGLLAEYQDAEALVAAARRCREAGYTAMDAFSPYPIEALDEALGIGRTRLPLFVAVAAVVGGLGGYFLQYYTAVIDYPWMIGGKPLHSWPMFLPITFECTILVAGLAAAVTMIALNKLPEPYHPLFNVPEFERASQDRLFLCIEASDPKFDAVKTSAFLTELGAREVTHVYP